MEQGELSFGEVTSSGFTVYWSPFLGRTSYELSINNQAGLVVPASGDAVQSYEVDGLSSGTSYTVSLVNGGTETIRTRPLAPGTPIATQVLDTSIQLQWAQSSDGSVAGYEICYSPDDGSSPVYIAGRTTTQYTLEGLNSDTTYIISISALTGNPQVKSQKQTIFVTTIADTTIPMASNFAVTNTQAADHVIILEWDVPERASYDYFEVSYTPDVGYPSSPVRLPKAATSLSIMNALADKVYQFSLVSIRGDERTDPPLTTTGQIAVNNLIVVIGERTTTSLEILWGASASGSVNEYQVSYGGSTPIVVDGSSDRRVVIPGLSPGTEYTVTVQAINAGASVGDSMETASTLHEMNGLSAMVTDQASSMIHLTITPPFEDPMRYDGYNVRIRLGGVSSPVVQPVIPVAKSACPEIWIKKLEAATMYEIDIEWYNGLDISEAFRVQTSTVAAAPLDITLDELETDSMKVSWQEGTGSFSYYLVTYSPVGSTQMTMLVAKGEPRVLDLSGLVPGTAYTIMVQQQGQTPAQETHVQLTLPETINSLSVTPSKNVLDATWSAPSTGSYDGYRVCHYPRGTQNSPYTSGTTPSINLPGLNSLTYYLVTVSSSEESTYSEPTTITRQTLIGDPGDINIALEDIDTKSVRITWVAINSITRYTVGGGIGAPQTVTVNSPEEAEYTFTSLVPGTSYTFFVEPLGNQRREREQYTKPDMPRNLIFNTITANSISIKWERPLMGGVDSYRVTYSPSSDGSPASPHTITDNGQITQTLTVTNLLQGTTYTFNVYALVADLVSEPVTRGSGTYIGMDIGADFISTQFTVLWDVPTAGVFNQFQVTYDPYDPTRPNIQESPRIISVSSLNGAQEGSLLIYGLEPGQLYNVYVQTMLNGLQTDDGFGRISFRTPPLPVTDVVITQRTPYSLSLDWSDVISADIQYRITYAPMEGALFPNDEDSAQVLSSNQVSESQISARSLAPSKEYVFTVSPVSGDPSSFEQVGEPQTVVTYTQPLSPQNLVVGDVGVEEVSLSWNLPAEVNFPIAYYEIDLVPNEPTFPIRINSTPDRWKILAGLVSGREYQAVMRSVINVNGQVIYSEPVQSAFFLLDPVQPQSLSTPYVTTTELRVEWTLGNSDFTTFQVSLSKDSATILTTDTPERSLLLTNLTVATVYDISIRTVVQGQQTNMIKTSAGALIMAVTTKSEPPQNLMQDEVTSDSITVSWGAPLNVVNMYHIIVKDEDGANVADATVPSSETSYTVENLNPYTKYIITVAAQFNGLDSDAIEIEQTIFQGSK
ncbi:tenascin-N-like [Strongylocentrotus purpuratus]|uniref:Fibronectin type-III domain-containing protein n=1 Tax=Strongylocentrotus purpuratus TaxID=7668 RepID=A0A7M7P5X7_STRPU|nr:tenascin-N-like [Strongylocentrotus purpuratus]